MSAPTPKSAEGAWAQSLAISFRFLFLGIFVLGLGWLVSNCRLVPADSRAVVLRFGAVVRQAGPGLLLAMPRPFEDVLLLPSADRQIEYKVKTFAPQFSGGYGGSEMPSETCLEAISVQTDPRENGALILTGDMSVVSYTATIFFGISDAKAYVLAHDQIEPALERLFVASTIAVTGSRDLDTILVARPELETSNVARAARENLRTDMMSEVNRRLDQLTEYGGGLGITVGRIDLVPQFPAEAKSAFDRVLLTLQNMEAEAARARTGAETTTQDYNRFQDRMLTDTQARAEERMRDAQTKTAAIQALAQESVVPGNLLTTQIFSERIGQVFGKALSVTTTDAAGGTRLIVPGGNTR